MSKLVVIVDAGHGGNHPVTGQYMTPKSDGKFYRFLKPDGSLDFEIREGVINRMIAERFVSLARRQGVECVKIYHDFQDTHRTVLARKANEINMAEARKGNRCILLSFHSNAFGIKSEGQGEKPKGFCVYTTRGLTESDLLATFWFEEQKKLAGNLITYRTEMADKDVDWEANFTVIFNTAMPAVLVENLFFTNREDALLLLDEKYQNLSAQAALNAVQRYQKWQEAYKK